MSRLAAAHPLLYGAALFMAALVASLPLMLVLQGMGMATELASAFARLAVAVVLAVLMRARIAWSRMGTGLMLALPVLGFVAWNLAYNALGGGSFVSPSDLLPAVVMGLAPGALEELVFRGATIDALRKHGCDDLRTLVLSAVLFSVMHLTNIVGMDLASALVQVGYSLIVGLVFGAIYLASDDILTVVLGHAAIDIASQLFATHPTTTSLPAIGAFVVLLVAEAAYALWLVRGKAERRS